MIYLLCPGSHDAAALIVGPAFQRSCGRSQVARISPAQWTRQLQQQQPAILVVISPPDAWSGLLIRTLRSGHIKTILLGSIPVTLAGQLGAQVEVVDSAHREAAQCLPASTRAFADSALQIEYTDVDAWLHSPLQRRPFLRYDFTDEWNNLGYGAIRADDSLWALSQCVQLPAAHTLASIAVAGRTTGSYAGLWAGECLLWFNRPVGPVDSQEWRMVESFLAHYAWPARPCQPVLSELPAGFDAAVTMRLDCDEDVESARPLWQAYQQLGVPFSLALHAKVLADTQHHALPREVLAHGGAILSHTATHAPDWGGSYAAAFEEATISADAIEQVTGQRVRFAVSPFHQTPGYARAALADAGYDGCIGGIIRNDPDFLMARSGPAPASPASFVGHSQQCMLHGDCMLPGADPLAIFKQAFDLARRSQTFFGYLDHPFSERYQYGWATEAQRIQMHGDFIHYMQASGKVLFANESDAMDFLLDRAAIDVQSSGARFHVQAPAAARSLWQFTVEHAGQSHALPAEGLTL